MEDRQAGWLTTKGLAKPRGWAFGNLDPNVWSSYIAALRADSTVQRLSASTNLYFYELHDLEFLAAILNLAADDAESRIGKALLKHLIENWSQLERFSKVEIAAVPTDLKPNLRKPPQAQQDERNVLSENLWLFRLRHRRFLPTTHGPRLAAEVWMPSQEIERRFSRRFGAGQLLPILDVDEELASRARPFCARLGVRESISPTTFGIEDARTILNRSARLFGVDPSEGGRSLDPADVREVIRPTYRNLIELLRGSDADTRFPSAALSDVMLLADNGHGSFRFLPSMDMLWAERNGTRERLGNPPDLWTFVLEAGPGLRSALTRLFGMRVLEEQLRWEPEPGEDALDSSELAKFRTGLDLLAPFIRLRLSADRPAEEARDAARLRRLLEVLTPVRDLQVGCRLDDRALSGLADRMAFVDTKSDTTDIRAFVAWGEHGWPPSPDDAEALATALADEFGPSNFEAFLMLISARNDQARRRLLSLAGAPVDLLALSSNEPEDIEQDAKTEFADGPSLPKESSVDVPEEVAEQPSTTPTAARLAIAPLYSAADLLIDGTPITVMGNAIAEHSGITTAAPHSTESAKVGRVQSYGGGTDLVALDDLGMFVAMTYEVTGRAGRPPGAIGICGSDVRTWRHGSPRLRGPQVLGHEFAGS